MNKIIVLLMGILVSAAVQAVDISGEIKNTTKLLDGKESQSEMAAKLDFKMKGDGFYSQITIKGNYTTEGTIEIDRGYTEIYKGKVTAGIGRQRISWGTGYLFNYADAYNEANPEDPKGEKIGVDSLKFRYDINDTARVEAVGVQNVHDEMDYAVRGATTLGKFEIMADYIMATPERINLSLGAIPNAKISNEYIILETRGEFEIGIWGALVYKNNTTENLPLMLKKSIKDEEKIGVIGVDYTFSLNEGSESSLYVLGEYSHNDTTEDRLLYGQVKYTVFKDLDITESCLADTTNGGQVYMNTINYVVNDYVTASAGYNKYNESEKSTYLSMMGENKDELYFTLKSNF